MVAAVLATSMADELRVQGQEPVQVLASLRPSAVRQAFP
jgi:hypothetical protein